MNLGDTQKYSFKHASTITKLFEKNKSFYAQAFLSAQAKVFTLDVIGATTPNPFVILNRAVREAREVKDP